MNPINATAVPIVIPTPNIISRIKLPLGMSPPDLCVIRVTLLLAIISVGFSTAILLNDSIACERKKIAAPRKIGSRKTPSPVWSFPSLKQKSNPTELG